MMKTKKARTLDASGQERLFLARLVHGLRDVPHLDDVRHCHVFILSMTGKKQADLAEVLGMSSKQAMSNKVRMNRWSADDLIKAAELCGGKVAIIMPDGQTIQLRNDEDEKSPDA